MNAPAIPRRQIHLGRQHIAQRRTERSDIGHQWPCEIPRLCVKDTCHELHRPCSRDRSFQKRTAGTVEWQHVKNSLSVRGDGGDDCSHQYESSGIASPEGTNHGASPSAATRLYPDLLRRDNVTVGAWGPVRGGQPLTRALPATHRGLRWLLRCWAPVIKDNASRYRELIWMWYSVSLEYGSRIPIGLNHYVSSSAVNMAGWHDPFGAGNLLLCHDESDKCRVLCTIMLL